MTAILQISGTMIPMRGDDVDTDRIIPARYLRAVTFEGLEANLFEDEREEYRRSGRQHPVDAPAFKGARVMVVGKNFGCGSSREHAPQSIQRWGIGALIGVSFSQIFFGNSVAMGLPCAGAREEDILWLMELAERSPDTSIVVDVKNLRARVGDREIALTLPAAAHDAFVSGAWDATGLLLENFDDVRGVAARLPYVSDFTA